jgi:hypothetical protein
LTQIKTNPEQVDGPGIECIQESGETLFVPSSWFHYVYNLVMVTCISALSVRSHIPQEDTLSINHNWLNGANIDACWNYIKKEHQLVKDELLKWSKGILRTKI